MWPDFLKAFALVLVFEGVLPFLKPHRWRSLMSNISQQSDQQLRIMGMISMLAGVVIMYCVRG